MRTAQLRASRRGLLRGAVALTGLGLLSACQPAGLELARLAPRVTPTADLVQREAGVPVYALAGEVQTLDPTYAVTAAAESACLAIYDGLVASGPRAEPRPALAESWRISSDGLTYTFDLRRGVLFQDGTPFDAAAAQYSLERLLGDERPPRRGLLAGIVRSARATDLQSLELRLERPFALLLHHLAQVGARMVSPTAHRQWGRRLGEHPVGTGPFRFVERAAGRIVLQGWAGSWRGAPRLDGVLLRGVPDEATRLALLERGEADLAAGISLERLAELRDHEQIAADVLPSARGMGVALNTQVAPLNDRRVRLALNHAIDKQALAQSVYQGQATVLGGPVAPHVFGAYPQTPFTYDPSRARALLSEAGYPAGLELPLLSSQGRQPRDAALARALQRQLQAVGIRPRLELADHAGYVDATTKGLEESGLRLSLIGWLPNTGEIREALFPLFHSSQWPPSGFNTSFLRSPRLDEALEQGSREIEPGRRERQFWQAQELVREEAPWIFLLSPSALVARSRRLHEPHLTTTELVSVSERTWLE